MSTSTALSLFVLPHPERGEFDIDNIISMHCQRDAETDPEKYAQKKAVSDSITDEFRSRHKQLSSNQTYTVSQLAVILKSRLHICGIAPTRILKDALRAKGLLNFNKMGRLDITDAAMNKALGCKGGSHDRPMPQFIESVLDEYVENYVKRYL